MDYVCIRLGCTHRHTSVHDQCSCPFTSILVLCPICESQYADHQEFYTHIVEVHVLRTARHFHIWTDHVWKMLVVSGYEFLSPLPKRDPAYVWKAWRFALLSLDTVNLDLRCPECNVAEVVEDGRPVMHHLTILAESAYLARYRRQILALFPDFGSHPVFEDIFPRTDHVRVFRLKKVTSDTKALTMLDSGRSDVTNTASAQANATSQGDSASFSPSTSLLRGQTSLRTEHYAASIDPSVLSGVGGQFHDVLGGPSQDRDMSVMHNASKSNRIYSSSEGELFSSPLRPTGDIAHVFQNEISILVPPAIETSASKGKGHLCDHPNCDYAFERQSDLRLHKRSHLSNNARPYSCSQCPKRFLYPKDLHRHTKNHGAAR